MDPRDKPEGDELCCSTLPIKGREAQRQAQAVIPLPPCGEGLGVGVILPTLTLVQFSGLLHP